MEFIPADDEKGPGLRLKHKARGKRVKQAGCEANQPKRSLSLRPFATNSSLRFGKPTVGWRRPNGPSIVLGSGPGCLEAKNQVEGPVSAGYKTCFNPRQDAEHLNSSWHSLSCRPNPPHHRNGEFAFFWVDYRLPAEILSLV